MGDNQIQRVGLGVDLDGGGPVIQGLADIYGWIAKINAEARNVPRTITSGASGGASSPNSPAAIARARQTSSDSLGQLLKKDEAQERESLRRRNQTTKVFDQERANSQKDARRTVDAFFDAADKRRVAQTKVVSQQTVQIAEEEARRLRAIHSFYEPKAGTQAHAAFQQNPDAYVKGIQAAENERTKMARYEKAQGRGYVPEGGMVTSADRDIGARARAEVARLRQQQEERDKVTAEQDRRTRVAQSEAAADRYIQAEQKRRSDALRAKKEAEEADRARTADIARMEAAARRQSEGVPPPSTRRTITADPARAARLAESRRLVQEAQFEGEFAKPRAALDKTRESLFKLRTEADKISLTKAGTTVGATAQTMSRTLGTLQGRVVALRKEIDTPASMGRTKELVHKDLAAVNADINKTIAEMKLLKEQAQSAPGRFRGGGPGGPGGGRFDGPDSPFSALSTASRIGRNLIIYSAVRTVTTDLREFIGASLEAAKVAQETQTQLEFTAKAAQVSFESSVNISDRIRKDLKLGRRLSDEAVAESIQLSEQAGTLGNVEGITRAITDINAKRGRGIEKIAENIRTVAIGGRGYQELFGVRPDTLYEREAGRRAQAQEQSGIGTINDAGTRYLTHKQRVDAIVASLSDQEKAQIRVNEVLRQGNETTGAAERRAGTLAGRLENINQRWEDGKVALGNFLLALTPVLGLLEKVANVLGGIDPDRMRLIGTGQGGQITNLDVQRHAQGAPNTAAYRASRFIEDYGPSIAGGLGVSAVGLLSGRRLARQEAASKAFQMTYDRVFGETQIASLAEAEATSVANAARPSIRQSVGAGLRRITTAITTKTLDFTSSVAQFIGATSVSDRLSGVSSRIRGRQNVALSDAAAAQAARYGQFGGTAGGLTGGYLGLQAGAKIAETLKVGTIAAGVITVLGGVAGTAAGTAIGNAGAAALGAGVANAGGVLPFLAANPVGVAAVVTGTLAYLGISWLTSSRFEALKRTEAITGAQNTAIQQQQDQLKLAREEGRTYFRERGTIDPRTGRMLGLGDAEPNLTRRYTSEEAGQLSRADKSRLEEVIEDPSVTAVRREWEARNKAHQEWVDKGTQEFWDARQKEQQEKEQQLVRRQETALARLRDFEASSVSLIGDVAGRLVTDNPFVSIFAEGATAAERMKTQWDFMGQSTVDYFTKLEQKVVTLRALSAEFENLAQKQKLLGEASSLERQRSLGGITGPEGRLIEAYKSSVNAATQNPELYDRARWLQTGYNRPVDSQIDEQLDNLRRNRGGLNGIGPEARDAVEGMLDKALIGIADKVGPAIQSPRFNTLRLDTMDALRREAQRNDRETDRAMQRVVVGGQAQAELERNLNEQRALAQRAVNRGIDPLEAQSRLDKQVLAITGAIDPKELTGRQYQGRIDALKREAERVDRQQEEARRAIKEAQETRTGLLNELQAIRKGLLQGDLSMLVRVLNDTKARIDAEDLQSTHAEGVVKYSRISAPPRRAIDRYGSNR